MFAARTYVEKVPQLIYIKSESLALGNNYLCIGTMIVKTMEKTP